MYSVPFEDDKVKRLISWYVTVLQKALNIIWDNTEWVYDFKRFKAKKHVKFKVPKIPKNSAFKKKLRDELMKDNPYAKHWIDAVIRTAYSILESWRKRYIKGRARKVKPRIRRRFARCKITLMKIDYERKTIRITLKPHEYVEVSFANTWFIKRVKGWAVGEVTLKDDRVLIPFKRVETAMVNGAIGWDCNELTVDGFSPNIGFIHVDLKPLITTRIIYQEKRRRVQSIASKKLKNGEKLLSKYSHREKDKCKDIERKLATQLVNLFPNTLHGFEKLNKEEMLKHNYKSLRKRIARVSWRNIVGEIKQRTVVKEVGPKNTSRTSSRCGFKVKDLRGQVFKCPKCGLVIDRQKNACINIYLKMRGLAHSKDWWDEVVKPLIRQELWVGVALRGRMPMIWSPMKGDLTAMKPKRLVDQNTRLSIKVHQP